MAQAVTSVAGWRPWWRGMEEATAVSPAADRPPTPARADQGFPHWGLRPPRASLSGPRARQALVGARPVAPADEQWSRAARLFGATQVLLDKVGGKLDGGDAAELDRDLAAVRAQLDAQTFAHAWDGGQAMPPEQATAYALEAPPRMGRAGQRLAFIADLDGNRIELMAIPPDSPIYRP